MTPTPETAGKETLVERLRKLRAELAFGGDADAASMVGEAITQLAKAVEALEEIDQQYENPNLSHLDFRVGAKKVAESTLLQIKGEKR